MNCRDAKVTIALHLGNDADPDEWEQARRHASTCAECRVHYRSLKRSLAVLEQSDVEQTYDVPKSLWPDVKGHLKKLSGQKQESRPRSWAPFISFTVACLLFLAVWVNPPRDHASVNGVNHSGRSMSSPFVRLLDQPRKERDLKNQDEIEPLSEEKKRLETL